MDGTKRQVFQSGAQVLIIFLQGLATALFALGAVPTGEQIYLSVLGSLVLALGSAAALFGISKAQVGGIANEKLIVKALHSDPETGVLLPGTTARELAKPAPEALK